MAAPGRRGAVRVGLGSIEMLRSSFGAMVRHARAADADPDPNVEAQAVFRSAEMVRRCALDHAVADAAARRMVEEALARLEPS